MNNIYATGFHWRPQGASYCVQIDKDGRKSFDSYTDCITESKTESLLRLSHKAAKRKEFGMLAAAMYESGLCLNCLYPRSRRNYDYQTIEGLINAELTSFEFVADILKRFDFDKQSKVLTRGQFYPVCLPNGKGYKVLVNFDSGGSPVYAERITRFIKIKKQMRRRGKLITDSAGKPVMIEVKVPFVSYELNGKPYIPVKANTEFTCNCR